MNLYKISQDVNVGYDTYDSAVVAAKTEDDARQIHPYGGDVGEGGGGTWASVDKVQVKLIGKAVKGTERGVVVASFNAG